VNAAELLQLMQKTREHRRSWIERCSPTATEILQKFPRFVDLENSVRTRGQHSHTDTYHSIICEENSTLRKEVRSSGSYMLQEMC